MCCSIDEYCSCANPIAGQRSKVAIHTICSIASNREARTYTQGPGVSSSYLSLLVLVRVKGFFETA